MKSIKIMKINFEGTTEELKSLISTITPITNIDKIIIKEIEKQISADKNDNESEDLYKNISETQRKILNNMFNNTI